MLIIYVPMLKDHINSLSVVTHIFLCHNLACREPLKRWHMLSWTSQPENILTCCRQKIGLQPNKSKYYPFHLANKHSKQWLSKCYLGNNLVKFTFFQDLRQIWNTRNNRNGTHISIKKQKLEVEQAYYAVRKACHTLNVQIVSTNSHLKIYQHSLMYVQISDFDLRIIGINAKYGGCAHDSYVWNNSLAKRQLHDEYEHNLRKTWLLGMYFY